MESFDFFVPLSVHDTQWLVDQNQYPQHQQQPQHQAGAMQSFDDALTLQGLQEHQQHLGHLDQHSHLVQHSHLGQHMHLGHMGGQQHIEQQQQQQQQQPLPQMEMPPMNKLSLQEQQIQLDILRETRRIRELELKIAEERRVESEARRAEREAEVTLAHTQGLSRASPQAPTPDADMNADGSWMQPSLQDLFGFFGTPMSSTTASASTSTSAPAPSASPVLAAPAPAATPVAKKKAARLVEERDAHCRMCGKFIAKLLLRGSRAELDTPFDLFFQCEECVPVKAGPSSRKRGNTLEDTSSSTICDVCVRVQGHGGFRPKERSVLSFLVEVVCATCLEKYRRCSNCGGGSARGGIGKWRCKELFENNRKTCSLSHARLGARDMELAVWRLPEDTRDRKELPALLDACDQLWREHSLAKMAVPEVLEHQSGLTTWDEINSKILAHGFSARPLFTQPPHSPEHRTYVSLVWAKARARRDKSKPEWATRSADEKSIAEWVAYNTRRSSVLYPANSVLCGAWVAEWNVKDRTFLMSTICPFDYVDVEDRSPLSFGEMLHQVLVDLEAHNAALAPGEEPWAPPEHLWAGIKTNPFSLRTRLVETLERRLGFIPLDEYLTRYPGTTRDMFGPAAAQLAALVDARPSVDNREMTVVCKYLGRCITREAMDRVREGYLTRKPRVESKFDE